MSGYEFSKQPVSPPPASDNEVVSSDGGEQPRPLSLLSSMMAGQASPKRKTLVSGYTSGPSAPSTAPSTTFSSPQPQDEPVSILRRNSIGSDGEPFFLPLARVLPISPEKKPEPLVCPIIALVVIWADDVRNRLVLAPSSLPLRVALSHLNVRSPPRYRSMTIMRMTRGPTRTRATRKIRKAASPRTTTSHHS